MAQKVPAMQEKVKAFRKEFGGTKVGDVTVDMVSPSVIIIWYIIAQKFTAFGLTPTQGCKF